MTTGDAIFKNDAALGSGATASHTLKQPGASNLSGSATRSSSDYDVQVIWIDEDGTEIETESIASGVTAGTQTTFDVPARSPYAKLEIVDTGTAGSGSYDLVGHLR